MALPRNIRSVKRFGPRYGRRVRHKLGKIESQQKKSYQCPYCNYMKAKRLSAGIWGCKKCGSKFTSKAYHVAKKKATVAVEKKETSEIQEEESLYEE